MFHPQNAAKSRLQRRGTFEPLYRPSVHVECASHDFADRSGPVRYFEVMPAADPAGTDAREPGPTDPERRVNLFLFYLFVVVVTAYGM